MKQWIYRRGQQTSGGPPVWGLGEVVTLHRKKNCDVTKNSQLSDLDIDRIGMFLNNKKSVILLNSHIVSATLLAPPLPLPSPLKQKEAKCVGNLFMTSARFCI
jgi:hypothetical protein